jgi:hypothetical protein
VPGIQPADIRELIDHGAKAVVLSKGMGAAAGLPRNPRGFGQEGH